MRLANPAGPIQVRDIENEDEREKPPSDLARTAAIGRQVQERSWQNHS